MEQLKQLLKWFQAFHPTWNQPRSGPASLSTFPPINFFARVSNPALAGGMDGLGGFRSLPSINCYDFRAPWGEDFEKENLHQRLGRKRRKPQHHKPCAETALGNLRSGSLRQERQRNFPAHGQKVQRLREARATRLRA